MRDKVNLNAAFKRISTPWTPLVAGELNGQHVKLAKASGSFVWHHHTDADELFMVVEGLLHMHLPPGMRAVPDPQSVHRVSVPHHQIQSSVWYLLTRCQDWLTALLPEMAKGIWCSSAAIVSGCSST